MPQFTRACATSSPGTTSSCTTPPPYSPVLAPSDYFLFPKLKRELAGIIMTQEEFKKKWEGVLRMLSRDDFARAFRRWLEHCEKCIRINGGYVEKS